MSSTPTVLEPVIIDGKLYVPMTQEELVQINRQLQQFAESRKKSREWMAKHKKPKKDANGEETKKTKPIFVIKTDVSVSKDT
jgi:hypothetical protein